MSVRRQEEEDRRPLLTGAKFLAATCAALFAGAARPGFPRARALQASLAVMGGLSAGCVWWHGGDRAWLVAFTVVVITPVYAALLDPSLSAAAPEARALLVRWGRLHAVRTVLGLVALVSLLSSLVRR